MTEKPARKLRWFRFSLRTLLIVVVLLSLPLGWVVRRAERQRKAVEAIREAGGTVYYEREVDDWAMPMSIPDRSAPTPLMELMGEDFFSEVRSVAFSCPDGLVVDGVLKHVKGLEQLRLLYLSDPQVTDIGVEHLKGMTELRLLWLDDVQLTDVGLEHLMGLTNLVHVSLRNTQITDAGLEHLKGLTKLGDLDLSGTRATEEGIRQLRKALPNCDISWSPPDTNYYSPRPQQPTTINQDRL